MSKKHLDNTLITALMAHELKGPIGAIRAAASLLASGSYGKLPKQAQDTVLLIQNASDRLLSQTEAYLQVMQLTCGEYQVKLEPCDANDLINKLIAEWRPQFKIAKLKLVHESEKIPSFILLDKAVLSHVIYNLLGNAVKYTRAGSIHIKTAWKKDLLTIKITDTGIGMSPVCKKSLFTSPVPREKNPQNDNCGLGLGLYISAELIKASKGKIKGNSLGLNKGSTFIVQLPAVKVDALHTGR